MKTARNFHVRTSGICAGLSWLAWCGMGGSCNDTLRTNVSGKENNKSLECCFGGKRSECAREIKTIDDRYEKVMSETS